MCATEQALAIPHILGNVLLYLQALKGQERRRNVSQYHFLTEENPSQGHISFVQCAQVCKLWADIVTTVIWQHYPPINSLRAVSPLRRQYYAQKVRRLHLDAPYDCSNLVFSFLSDLEFPCLTGLKISVNLATHFTNIAPLLRAPIEKVEFSTVHVLDFEQFKTDYLDIVAECCKSLKRVRFASAIAQWPVSPDMTVEGQILDFLHSTCTVTDIQFACSEFPGVQSIFSALSKRRHLRSLHLMLFSQRITEPLKGPVFTDLRSLSLVAHFDLFVELIPQLPHLEELRAYVPGPRSFTDIALVDCDLPDSMLALASTCHCLRVMELGFGQGDESSQIYGEETTWAPCVSGPALVAFSKGCPKLTVLNIFSFAYGSVEIHGTDLTDEHLGDFARNLPRLTSLRLELHPFSCPDITWWSLRTIGLLCRHLEVCEISAHLEPLQLAAGTRPDPAALFTVPMWALPADIIRSLGLVNNDRALFPRLRTLGLAVPPERNLGCSQWIRAMRAEFPLLEQVNTCWETECGDISKAEYHPSADDYDYEMFSLGQFSFGAKRVSGSRYAHLNSEDYSRPSRKHGNGLALQPWRLFSQYT